MRHVFSTVFFFALCAACSDNGGATLSAPPDGGGGDVYVPGMLGVGAACDAENTCRVGLVCTMGKCEPSHATPDGSPCAIDDECRTSSYCGATRTCVPRTGSGQPGDACKSDADCAAGERCEIVGISTQCVPQGGGDVGGACGKNADCFAPLTCQGKQCEPPSPNPFPWPGADCADDPAPTRAYFRVPRGTGDGDFYRLPFPNDVRLKNGRPDLTGHPTPGAGVLGFDAVDRYLRDVEQNTDGWSAYPTITFRFSAGVDFDSLKLDGSLRFFDVTAATPTELGFGWTATTARNKYLCANPLKIRPALGAPLVPGHTYAMIVTTQVVDANKQPIMRSPDLDALLAASQPADPALAAAWPAYKPLRDLLAKTPLAVLDATVFTVAHADARAKKLPAAVAAAPAPAASQWVKCDGVAKSPCPDSTGARACPTSTDPAFDELHALVSLPIFQRGNEPYLDPQDGGDFQVAADGTPILQRVEQVCMALTVPKGAAMPAGGWPLVVFAHGTGGSFRSAVTEGVAARMANLDDGNGTTLHVAVLGIDQVEHGPRRGGSMQSPNDLFYDFANPAAARGNPLQGAADQLALVRFAKALDLPAASSPTGAEIKLGGTIAFWGHSQGATSGGISLPYDADVAGVVLSGEGASLTDALLTKKSPVDVADALPYALQDPDVDVFHPVLTILQNAIDPADPLLHAAALALAPPPPAIGHHVLQPYGQLDTFSPPATERTFALAAGLLVIAPPAGVMNDPINDAPPVPPPAGGNVTTMGGRTLTAVVREYAPNGYDGHFVAFRDATAERDVDRFLADVLEGKIPSAGR